MTDVFDPLVPRPIDRPTAVPLSGDLCALDEAKILAAPDDAADRAAWRESLRRWRSEARERLAYSGARYDLPGGRWTASAYSVGLVWLWDELLYDLEADRFTPDRLLADARRRFGGWDAVVLWHAYPVIGIDERNQWDYYRDVTGLPALVRELQQADVRVFVDYNPWDVGTRRTGRDDATELAALVADLGVDGVFLDTLKEADSSLFATLDGVNPALALEGESKLPLARVEDHALSWAQWFADSEAPGVLRSHWYERRHQLHHTRRWNRDHSDELQSAWVNGTGMLVWEVVFGAWVGWNARDCSTLRRMVRVQRAAHDLLVDGEWTPLVDGVVGEGVYASRFDSADLALWTLVNRSATDVRATVDAGDGDAYDVTAGVRLDAAVIEVPARGVAGLLVVRGDRPAWLDGLLAEAAADRMSADASFPERASVRVVPEVAVSGTRPSGMLDVRPGPRELVLTYRRRETGYDGDAPYVEEWKPLPPRLHDLFTEHRSVEVAPVAVAQREVTGAEFAAFLAATGWDHPGVTGAPDEPITGVDLADARAYARWAEARLPTEVEWQAAAEDGAYDRTGPRVWNWTESEHSDGRTRWCLVKGGSDYAAEGSDWYVDGGAQDPTFGQRLLLLGAGLSRSARIGFRVAVDRP